MKLVGPQYITEGGRIDFRTEVSGTCNLNQHRFARYVSSTACVICFGTNLFQYGLSFHVSFLFVETGKCSEFDSRRLFLSQLCYCDALYARTVGSEAGF